MAGKVLKISGNDLSGNVDDRKVMVYACFLHKRYMNNYVVFSFDTDGKNKKLYYGSIHLKKHSLVIFDVKPNIKKYIDEFLNEYINNNMVEYEVLDIEHIQKVELVSYNEMEYDKINDLENKSIVKEIVQEEVVKEKKPVFLYLLLLFMIIIGGGLTLLYFKPDLFTIKYKKLECVGTLYDENIMLNYKINKEVKFDRNDKVEEISSVRTYAFFDSLSYEKFKKDNEDNKYFNNGEGYKYNDKELTFKLIYKETSVIDDYDEMLTYLKNGGYSCIETEYEE